MYGMVNRAIKEMVSKSFGEETWESIKERANVEAELFISNEPYDDHITYDLVAAASEELQQPPDAILESFGRYWILETGRKGYAELFEAGGRNLREFLEHLPNFHTRISMILPKLQPPVFRVLDSKDDHMLILYQSKREGLQPFVLGLFAGLGTMFEEEIDVIHSKNTPDGDEFEIRWRHKQSP